MPHRGDRDDAKPSVVRSRNCAKPPRLATQSASKTITRTLNELQDTTKAAVEQSKQTASATVSEILETHDMLRSDTTALFERLREANILLQEVLSGAHENMSSIESTLVTRVSDFVAAMNEVAEKAGAANSEVERNITQLPDDVRQDAQRSRRSSPASSTPTAARSRKRSR